MAMASSPMKAKGPKGPKRPKPAKPQTKKGTNRPNRDTFCFESLPPLRGKGTVAVKNAKDTIAMIREMKKAMEIKTMYKGAAASAKVEDQITKKLEATVKQSKLNTEQATVEAADQNYRKISARPPKASDVSVKFRRAQST